MTEPSSSSMRFRCCDCRITLRKATRTKAPTAAWIQVGRRRGVRRPPTIQHRAQTANTNGSTSRSNFMSIGSCTVSWMSLNGISQSTARKSASIHGSSRDVCGHGSSAGGTSRDRTPTWSRRRVAYSSPPPASAALIRNASAAIAIGMPELTTPPCGAPIWRSRMPVVDQDAVALGDALELVLQRGDLGVGQPDRLLGGGRSRVDVEDRRVLPRLRLDRELAALVGDLGRAFLECGLDEIERDVGGGPRLAADVLDPDAGDRRGAADDRRCHGILAEQVAAPDQRPDRKQLLAGQGRLRACR